MPIEITIHSVGDERPREPLMLRKMQRAVFGRNPTIDEFKQLGPLPLDSDDIDLMTLGRFRDIKLSLDHLSGELRGESPTISRVQFAIVWTREGAPRLISLGSRPIRIQPLGEIARPLVAPDLVHLGPATTVWLPADQAGIARRITILNPYTARFRGEPRPMNGHHGPEVTVTVDSPNANRLIAALVKASPLLEFPPLQMRPHLPRDSKYIIDDRLRKLKPLLVKLHGGETTAGKVETEHEMLSMLLSERHLTLDAVVALRGQLDELMAQAEQILEVRKPQGDRSATQEGQFLVGIVGDTVRRVDALEGLLTRIDELALRT